MPLGEYVPPKMFTNFGFKESDSHPLKLMNVTNVLSEVSVPGKSVHELIESLINLVQIYDIVFVFIFQ